MSASEMDYEPHPLDGLSEAEIELLRARAVRYARAPETDAGDKSAFVLFERRQTRYAAALECLREIMPLERFCRIPGASNCVPGLFHYRGEILSLHDIEAFLGGEGQGFGGSRVIVLEHRGERIGLFSDELLGVELISSTQISPLPIAFGDRGECFQGVLEGGVLSLNVPRLFTTPEFFSAF